MLQLIVNEAMPFIVSLQINAPPVSAYERKIELVKVYACDESIEFYLHDIFLIYHSLGQHRIHSTEENLDMRHCIWLEESQIN